MARILGALGEGADGLIERMKKGVPRGQGESTRAVRVAKDDFAMCLVPNAGSFESGCFVSEDGTSCVAFDGFFPGVGGVLAGEGFAAGAPLGTGLLGLYRKHGPEFLKLVPGMFAIAIYDGTAKRLLVCSDRSGILPVYYAERPDVFLFGSSIGAVRAAAGSAAIDTAAVIEHLLFDATYGSATCYADIRILPYGAYLVFDADRRSVTCGSYFRYEDLFDPREYERNRSIDAPRELTAHLKSCLGRIVEDRDSGSFGLLCGGGIDCSYIGAVLNEIGFRIPFFCTNVAGGRVSEESMAQSSATYIGSTVVVGQLTRERYYPLLLSSIRDFGQPIAHPNQAKFYVSADLAATNRRRSQMMGVASDLLFGSIGNVRTYYRYLKTRAFLRTLGAGRRRTLAMLLERPDVVRFELRMRNPWHAIAGLGAGNFERGAMQERVSMALAGIPSEQERLLKTLMLENLCDYQQHLLNRRFEIGSIHGVSLYFPFLDLEMLSFGINLPVKHSVRWNVAKLVVREAARPYLGLGIARRAKWGGDIPLEEWIVPLAFLLKDGFLENELRFDVRDLGRIVEANPKLLWNLVDVELWGRMCLWNVEPERILDEMRSRGIPVEP
ncbi:MAG: asparagine synthase-related protein [Candidatus Krumholzibacteriia bacterium]